MMFLCTKALECCMMYYVLPQGLRCVGKKFASFLANHPFQTLHFVCCSKHLETVTPSAEQRKAQQIPF